MTVVETPLFLRKAAGPMTEEERAEMVAFVGANPEAGEMVPGTGGEEFPVFLLTIYGKSQQANLTKAERNEMKKLLPSLVGGYWKGRQR